MRVAIIGANGLLGSAVYSHFRNFIRYHDTIGITRENYSDYCGETFDIVINANGNSKKYWATKNVVEDFESSVLSVYKSLFDFNCNLYVFVSTADALGQSVYGFHKHMAESIVQRHKDNFLILRCCALIGDNLKKGVVYDIMNDIPLFVTRDSRLQFITVNAVADIINYFIVNDLLNYVLNVGGKENTSIEFIEHLLSKDAQISEDVETQIYNMDVSILESLYPLKSSDDYLKEFIEKIM